MTQTAKDPQNSPQRRGGKPGQRQQERLARIARRRRRRQIIAGSLAAVIVVSLATFGFLQYQRINAEQAAAAQKVRDQQATATAAVVQPTQTAVANATATAGVAATSATATVTAKPTATAFAQAVQTATTGSPTPKAGYATPPPVNGKKVSLSGGLQYIDIKVGTGTEVKEGGSVQVLYTGWLESNGKKFDSSFDRGGEPFTVTPVGQAQVIQGWNEGLIGMKAGGTRRLIIPASLAYGAEGRPPTIPGNATLIFDVIAVTVQ